MSGFRKYLFVCLTALCLSVGGQARAQENYYNADDQPAAAGAREEALPSSHSIVVTSIQKCYAQLSHAEVLDIETNFVKPYEECRKRLALKLKKKNQLKAGQQKETPAAKNKKDAQKDTEDAPDDTQSLPDNAPPVSGGFYRVQKDPLPAERRSATDSLDASGAAYPAPAPKPKSQNYNFNR